MIKTALVAGLALALLAHAAAAQRAVIERCKQTSSDADRIACLEAALLGRDPGASAEPLPAVEPPVSEPGAVPEAADLPVTAAADEPAAEPPAAHSTTLPAAPAAEPAGIGAEQVIARNQAREGGPRETEQVRNLRVASYDTVPFERLVVRLENGQVWRQIKGDNQRIRVDLKRNQTVDISKATMSGYKLRLNEIRRTIRVERIK